MFDSEKAYTIHVWNMPVCVVDDETGDFIRNEDGSIKLFQIPKYDFSHICDEGIICLAFATDDEEYND